MFLFLSGNKSFIAKVVLFFLGAHFKRVKISPQEIILTSSVPRYTLASSLTGSDYTKQENMLLFAPYSYAAESKPVLS